MKTKKAEYQMDRVLSFMNATLAKLGRAPTKEEVEGYLLSKRLASKERAAELAAMYEQSREVMATFHQKSVGFLKRIRRKRSKP